MTDVYVDLLWMEGDDDWQYISRSLGRGGGEDGGELSYETAQGCTRLCLCAAESRIYVDLCPAYHHVDKIQLGLPVPL